ncbi:hypothetical protein Q5752_003904 [Cryptotrichosporon argae]
MAREQDEAVLEADDYLYPLTTIRDTLLRPVTERQLSQETLRALLKYHLPSLRTPWAPFLPPSAASRKLLAAASLTLPRTTASFKVEAGARDISTRLADLVRVDETVAFWFFKSYAAYSIEPALPRAGEDEALLERLQLWYEQELLAVPQIVMALYVPPSEPTGWEQLAADLKGDILGDEASYIEGLFRAFSGLAQKQVEESGPRTLFWVSLQLRQQEAILDNLFLVLYQYSMRSASVSEGLLRGAIMSGFGTLQANREIFESDPDSVRAATRIRDLLLVIAVESLCLAQVVSPEVDAEAFGGTLLHARDRIHSVHQFILEQTEDLAQAQDELPQWPIAVVALAWAIVLRSLPNALLPPSTDYFQLDTNDMTEEPAVHVEVASRALRLSAGLFPWLEEVLSGALFEAGREVVPDMAALRRSPFKDLLIGLCDLLDIDHIADRSGLYRSWELLFGGGLLDTSTSLCNNFWAVDFPYAERRALLDRSRFPREPTHLPRLLAALTGVSSAEELDAGVAPATVLDVYDYVDVLPSIVIAAQTSTFAIRGKDGAGGNIVETSHDLVLPGAVIPRGTRGTALDDDITAISWKYGQSAWPLIIALLRGAAGLPLAETPVTLVDLGVTSTLPDILSANLRLVRCVLRSPDVAARLLAATQAVDRFPGQSLLDIALAVLAGDRSDTVTSALDIIQSLLRVSAEDVGNALRASGFFDPTGRRPASVGTMIHADAARGEHALTIALLRLVRSLVASSAGPVVQSALKLVLGEVWSQFGGWRYRDIARKHEIATILFAIFELAVRRGSPVLAAAFITAASPLTYKPILDAITQASPLATKLIQSRREADANLVFASFDQAVTLLSTLVRAARHTSAAALPHSLFAATVGKTQLVDALFSLLWDPSLQDTSLRLLLRLLRVHLEASASDLQRPALSGMLRDVGETADKLTTLAFQSAHFDVKPDAWVLLASVVSTQPGCVGIVVDKALKTASTELLGWETALKEGPASLAAALGVLQAAMEARPRAFADELWQAIVDIATHYIQLPSSFSANIAHDVTVYSYSIQAKANATALLAAELARLDPDGPEPKAQTLVVSLFRNEGKLIDIATAAAFSCADPDVHAREGKALQELDVDLAAARTIRLPVEREYGPLYLYDTAPVSPDPDRQAAVGHALAILNLNWSQLDADVNLTKAFRALVDSVAAFTDGDALASKAALAAAVAVASEIAKEDRGGDVMFAIQAERIGILATLLESGLDDEPDTAQVTALAPLLRQILESQHFSPILSMRHDELPQLHRPVLQILLILSQSVAVSVAGIADILADAGADFALDAADIVLDIAARAQPSHDLPLVLSLLCELSRVPGWVDKLSEVNLVSRTLDVLVRTRLADGVVPAHVHSILVLHLALASSAHSAEKLAVSGILPAYADTTVIIEAEQGKISADGSEGATGMHAAWTAMLVVVKALLVTLPDTSTYARTDVVPFVRVTMRQLHRALEWDGERALSRPALDEAALVADVVLGLAHAVGPAHGVLDDFAHPALALLAGARYALSHPHRFTALLVPLDAAEQAVLEKEIGTADGHDVDLASERTPVIKDRTVRLVGVARNLVVALVRLTKAWEVLGGEEPDAQVILGADDSPSNDPVGILNDLVSLALPLAARLPRVSVASQLAEAAALLSLTQLMGRSYFLPPESADDDMDVDVAAASAAKGRRRSAGRGSLGGLGAVGKAERARLVVRELEGDLRGVLGDTGVYGALKRVAERVFE